jgi:response regulator RpfG family c-di-GMP phosphodiesterase
MTLAPQYRIVFIYLILGTSWIFFSDIVVNFIFDNKEDITFAQNIKGWLFILFTGLLLLILIRRDIDKITEIYTQLINSYDQTIDGWVHVMDLRHKETKDHTKRVTFMTIALAKLCGITNKEQLKDIERGSILHDIGKIGIPDNILIKPDSLDENEWDQIKTHPEIARDILSHIDSLKTSINIPYHHHEKWDGSGYPTGIKGELIPVEARIFAIIDVWDALIHPRVYKTAWPEEKVLNYIQKESGKHFDPNVAKVFIENYDQIMDECKFN